MSTEATLRETICRTGASLFNRGLTHGSTGNISASLPEGRDTRDILAAAAAARSAVVELLSLM